MNKFWRTWLLVLLAVTLPLQSWAVAAQLACQHGHANAVHIAPDMGHDDEADAPCHHADDRRASELPCSLCAACAVGWALLTTLPVLPAQEVAAAVPLSGEHGKRSPAGPPLDRPPRAA